MHHLNLQIICNQLKKLKTVSDKFNFTFVKKLLFNTYTEMNIVVNLPGSSARELQNFDLIQFIFAHQDKIKKEYYKVATLCITISSMDIVEEI